MIFESDQLYNEDDFETKGNMDISGYIYIMYLVYDVMEVYLY